MRMGKERSQSTLDFHCIYFTGENLVLSCSFVRSFLKSNLPVKKWEWIMRVRGLLLTTLTALKSLVCCSWFTPLHFWILKIPSCPPSCASRISWRSDLSWFHHVSPVLQGTGRHKHWRQTQCFTQQNVAKIRTNENRVDFSRQTLQVILRTPLRRNILEI